MKDILFLFYLFNERALVLLTEICEFLETDKGIIYEYSLTYYIKKLPCQFLEF